MAVAKKLAETSVVVKNGVVTSKMYDRVAPDHLAEHLTRSAAASIYGQTDDDTPLVSREVRSLLVFPFSRL